MLVCIERSICSGSVDIKFGLINYFFINFIVLNQVIIQHGYVYFTFMHTLRHDTRMSLMCYVNKTQSVE